jgi:hypothetical protein
MQQRPVRFADQPLLLQHVGVNLPGWSGNFSWFAEFGVFRGYPATRLAGEFHCGKFLLAHMGSPNIICPTIRTGKRFGCRIAEMTGIIGHGPATFTGMNHNRPPLIGVRKTE